MSITIKSVLFSFLVMSTQSLYAEDLKVLSVKEFYHKKESPKFIEENLNQYEINNDDLITLAKIPNDKKKVSKAEQIDTVLIADLK